MSNHPVLARRLTTLDAVDIGLGSMIGAGVFAAFTPAAQAAGPGLLICLLIASVVAYCNATSSAQLAAEYPASGGSFVYGRERLGPWPGSLAGWGFVVGKTASSAALTRVIVVAVLAALAIVVAASWIPGTADPLRLVDGGLLTHSWYGILQSAGLLFFAFAGYARIATIGEEVINPRTTIPRAIVVALGIAVVVYAVIAVSILSVLGPDGIEGTPAHWLPPCPPAPGMTTHDEKATPTSPPGNPVGSPSRAPTPRRSEPGFVG